MDLAMPNLDGYSATRMLKSDPATASIPVVALTALAMRGDEDKAYAAGADGYLTKPIDRRALDGVLARFIASDRT
jgi:CheY-like chemotaxis protein